MKRCFISIELPEEIKEEIGKIQEQLPEFTGKFIEKENLHLTLKFLGEIDDEKIEEIKERLGKIDFNEFKCEIDSIGIFSENLVRIVWIHLNGCEEIQKKIDDVLGDIFEKEKRFMSHITIARVKSIKDKKKFLEELRKINIEKMIFGIDKFYLMESVLKIKGPEYRVIKGFEEEKI